MEMYLYPIPGIEYLPMYWLFSVSDKVCSQNHVLSYKKRLWVFGISCLILVRFVSMYLTESSVATADDSVDYFAVRAFGIYMHLPFFWNNRDVPSGDFYCLAV